MKLFGSYQEYRRCFYESWRLKELYIVRDVPRYEEECSNYCYVVKAESHAEAIDIVRKKTKHQWDWEAELADNKEVWEQIIGSIWKIKQ